jgi:hypothetical protein
MVATVKFSQFASGGTLVAGQTVVGLTPGPTNSQFVAPPQFIDPFVSTDHPVSPSPGTIGYATDLNAYQYYNGTAWLTFANFQALGQAAYKNVTNNALPIVASVLGSGTFTPGNILIAGDIYGTIEDGGNPVGTGTVTEIDTGLGLTGGPITSEGTISMLPTLPASIQGNITILGTVVTGTWNAGIISPAYGGTGINNGSSTITLGGNIAFSGAYGFTGTLTGITAVTFPTSGTLATVSQIPTGAALTEVNDTNVTLTLGGSPSTALVNAASLTLGWTGQLSSARGGTGVNNGSSTITLGGSLTFAGAYGFTGTLTNTTAVTFPTSGTLATTSQLPAGAALTEVNDTNVTLTLGGSPTTALLAATSLTLGWTGQLAVGRGGTGVSSVTIAPTASAFAGWDGNKNLSANNFIEGYAATVTAGSTTTLTVASAYSQFFTGSTTQTVLMPVVSTLVLGQQFYLVNNSSGAVTVQSSGANNIVVMPASSSVWLTCIAITGTTAASWNADFVEAGLTLPISLANGGTAASLTASNGGIVYSTASAFAVLAGTATAGLALLSGLSTAPTWSNSPPFTRINRIFITATGAGTYTPTAGTSYIDVEGVGGGGSSGGTAATSSSQAAASGGGGGGEYFKSSFTIAQIGASKGYVVGTGGAAPSAGNNNGNAGANTTFGSTLAIGVAGGGGAGGNAATEAINGGGAPGTGGTGTLLIPGAYGGAGNVFPITSAAWFGMGNTGGASAWCLTSPAQYASSVSVVTGYGGGGQGVNSPSSQAAFAGVAGSAGALLITEYIST